MRSPFRFGGYRRYNLEMAGKADVVATWVGALTRGGLLFTNTEERGVRMAVVLVGERRLAELREWFLPLSVATRLEIREAAISFCLHFFCADRVCSTEEVAFLEQVFDSCDLPLAERRQYYALLRAALVDVRKLPHAETIAEICCHPVLREILLAIGWHIALGDRELSAPEEKLWLRLARLFSIPEQRAHELAATIEAYGEGRPSAKDAPVGE